MTYKIRDGDRGDITITTKWRGNKLTDDDENDPEIYLPSVEGETKVINPENKFGLKIINIADDEKIVKFDT